MAGLSYIHLQIDVISNRSRRPSDEQSTETHLNARRGPDGRSERCLVESETGPVSGGFAESFTTISNVADATQDTIDTNANPRSKNSENSDPYHRRLCVALRRARKKPCWDACKPRGITLSTKTR